jgi:hypothetical protein
VVVRTTGVPVAPTYPIGPLRHGAELPESRQVGVVDVAVLAHDLHGVAASGSSVTSGCSHSGPAATLTAPIASVSSTGNPKTRTFAELLIYAEEDPYLRSVLVGCSGSGAKGPPGNWAHREVRAHGKPVA